MCVHTMADKMQIKCSTSKSLPKQRCSVADSPKLMQCTQFSYEIIVESIDWQHMPFTSCALSNAQMAATYGGDCDFRSKKEHQNGKISILMHTEKC